MKGYFSQLARRTGLHFANAAASRASDSKTRASRSLPPASPLHVEEVTFVPPAVTASETDKPNVVQHETNQTVHTVEPSTPPSFSEPSSRNVQLTASHNETRESTAAPIETKNVRPLSTEHQAPHPERDVERDQMFARPSNNEAPLERVETKFVPATSEPTKTFASLPAGNETKIDSPAQAVSDLNPRDPVKREVLVRQYLREVRAWVAAPPTPIPDFAESPSREESQLTSEWQPEDGATFAAEREPTSALPAQRDQIDVHETSLSIGAISVVIEDPKPAATTIAPTPSAPAARPQTQPEPISLSRYYLQRW